MEAFLEVDAIGLAGFQFPAVHSLALAAGFGFCFTNTYLTGIAIVDHGTLNLAVSIGVAGVAQIGARAQKTQGSILRTIGVIQARASANHPF